jgi:hypothetical protein
MARRKPLDPDEFITGLREEMRAELGALHDALPRLEFLQIAGRREGAIKRTPLDAAPEPRNLPEQRWCSLRPAPQQLARLCRCAGRLVAAGTPGRVRVGVPEHALISGRNALRGGGPGSAQRLPDLLRDDRGRVLAGDYREQRGDQFLCSRPVILGW